MSPAGWSILSDRSGEWIVEGYANIRRRGGENFAKVDDSGQFRLFKMLYEDSPQYPGRSYWGFGIQVPDGMEVRWGRDAEIRITGICKGDTVRYTSREILFTNWGNWYGFPVPGDRIWVTRDGPVVIAPDAGFFGPSKPENGNVIVAGKFDFEDCVPERIIRCDVSGVVP